jgi:hypothetical protein
MKSERFEMRAAPELLSRIDEWRRVQPDLPNRSQAIRRLIETGLKSANPMPIRRPKPSDGGAGGGEKRQQAASPKTPKAKPERSAQPAASKPLSKEAQLRALREATTP